MKKGFLAVISAILAVLLFVGCAHGNEYTSCEHVYTTSITKEATYDVEGEMSYTCIKCGNIYTEPIEKLTKHVVPTSILDEALSNSKYSYSVFSITVGKLVNRAMNNYKIKYLSGEEAIAMGYLEESDLDSSVDIDYLYYAVISGDTMMNPDIPYMTNYEEEAVKVCMIFDENDCLLNSGVTLCSNLETCAVLIMTSNY